MQIASLPPPIMTGTSPQDAVAKAASHVQAIQPLVQRAVEPPPKSEKSNDSRSNRDRQRSGGHPPPQEKPDSDDEHSVNLRV